MCFYGGFGLGGLWVGWCVLSGWGRGFVSMLSCVVLVVGGVLWVLGWGVVGVVVCFFFVGLCLFGVFWCWGFLFLFFDFFGVVFLFWLWGWVLLFAGVWAFSVFVLVWSFGSCAFSVFRVGWVVSLFCSCFGCCGFLFVFGFLWGLCVVLGGFSWGCFLVLGEGGGLWLVFGWRVFFLFFRGCVVCLLVLVLVMA